MLLFYCTITKYPEEAFTNIRRMKNIVDDIIVIHQYPCKEENKKIFDELKVRLYQESFNDDFSAYRNIYIQKVAELTTDKDNTWILLNDTDEFCSNKMLKYLKVIIEQANGMNVIKFNRHDVLVNPNVMTIIPRDPEAIVRNDVLTHNMTGYFKELLVKYSDGLHYEGKVNEKLAGIQLASMDSDKEAYFLHIKSETDYFIDKCRNYFIGDIIDNMREELKTLTDKYNYDTWEKLFDAMSTELPEDLVTFFRDNSTQSNIQEEISIENVSGLGHFYRYYCALNNIYIAALQDIHTEKQSIVPDIEKQLKLSSNINLISSLASENDEEIKQYVDSVYRAILLRPADPQGLADYTNLIKRKKIDREYLIFMLRNSSEYKERKLWA